MASSLFKPALLEQIARVAGDAVTGGQIDSVLAHHEILDGSGQSTKWRRLYWVLSELQKEHGSWNPALELLQDLLEPARFVGDTEGFERMMISLNTVLALAGLAFSEEGRFVPTTPVGTLREAERRVAELEKRFTHRTLHPEVLKYCREELLDENYYHAVFEAAKGLQQRVRDMTGLTVDGVELVEAALSLKTPRLVFNGLTSKTDRSEHLGILQLLKGAVQLVRNPAAHVPKVLANTADDAADFLALISLLHRKLDAAQRTSFSAKECQ